MKNCIQTPSQEECSTQSDLILSLELITESSVILIKVMNIKARGGSVNYLYVFWKG